MMEWEHRLNDIERTRETNVPEYESLCEEASNEASSWRACAAGELNLIDAGSLNPISWEVSKYGMRFMHRVEERKWGEARQALEALKRLAKHTSPHP